MIRGASYPPGHPRNPELHAQNVLMHRLLSASASPPVRWTNSGTPYHCGDGRDLRYTEAKRHGLLYPCIVVMTSDLGFSHRSPSTAVGTLILICSQEQKNCIWWHWHSVSLEFLIPRALVQQ